VMFYFLKIFGNGSAPMAVTKNLKELLKIREYMPNKDNLMIYYGRNPTFKMINENDISQYSSVMDDSPLYYADEFSPRSGQFLGVCESLDEVCALIDEKKADLKYVRVSKFENITHKEDVLSELLEKVELKQEEVLEAKTTRKLNKRACPLNPKLYSQNIILYAMLTCVTSDVDIDDLLKRWMALVEKCKMFYETKNLEMPMWKRMKHMWVAITTEMEMCYYDRATNFLYDLLINRICQCSCGTYALRELMIAIDKRFANSLVYIRSPGHLQLGYRDARHDIHIIETTDSEESEDELLNERVQTRRTRGEVSVDDVDWSHISSIVRIITEIDDMDDVLSALGNAMSVYIKEFTGVYRMFALYVSFLCAKKDSSLQAKLHEEYSAQKDRCLHDLKESGGSIDAAGDLDRFFSANIEKGVDHRRWYKEKEAKERAESKIKTYNTLKNIWGKKGKSKSTKRKLPSPAAESQ